MDLVFSFYDTIVVQDASDSGVKDVLHRVGAVRRPDREDWYDLPPEPVFARLPYDPDWVGNSISPKLRALGTAQVGVKLCDFAPDLRVLVVAVQTTLDTSMESYTVRRSPRWRELISSPGRAVLHGSMKQIDWSREGPVMAKFASTGSPSPDGLDLSLLCKRRAALLRRSVNELDIELVQSVDNVTLGAALGKVIYLSGSSIKSLDVPPTLELVDRVSEAAARRKILDVLIEKLRRISGEIGQRKDVSRLNHIDYLMDTSEMIASDLRSVSTTLDQCSHHQNAGLPGTLDEWLRISQDAHRCMRQVSQANHELTSRLVYDACMAIQRSVNSVSDNVESSIEELRLHVEERTTDLEAQVATRASSWQVCMTYLVCGAMLLVIAVAAILDVVAITLLLVGCGLMVAGIFGRFRGMTESPTRGLSFSEMQPDTTETNNAVNLPEKDEAV